MNDCAVIVIGGGAHGEAVHSACEAAAKAEVDAAFVWRDSMVSNYSDARRLGVIIAGPRNKIHLPRVEQLLRTDVEEP